ncbi:phiSA1p31-related protein [Streptomyces sp. NPDC091376]|uniref:phiSA1p31-related protein n=1 Tax=Streptomyces sp. NPDC091376 TaxID=3365994 RepID=UPI00380C33A7
MTEFKAGDKVNHRAYGAGEITYGPFRGAFIETAYLTRFGNGRERVVNVEALTAFPAFAVGDEADYFPGAVFSYPGTRVRLVAGPFKSEHHDTAIWVVEKANGTHMTPTENALRKVDEPAPDTYTHGGVTYDLTASYRDTDGDVWKFKRFDTGVRGEYGYYNWDDVSRYSPLMSSVVDNHGPLERVDN